MRLHGDADCSSICRVPWAERRKKEVIVGFRARTRRFLQECVRHSGRPSTILQRRHGRPRLLGAARRGASARAEYRCQRCGARHAIHALNQALVVAIDDAGRTAKPKLRHQLLMSVERTGDIG